MRYFPILLSKAGEFKALQELTPTVNNDVSPIIEVIGDSLARTEAKLISDWSFAGNQVLLDFSSYGIIDAGNIANIQQLFANIHAAGVNAIPVIQHNSSALFIQFVRNLVAQNSVNVCI